MQEVQHNLSNGTKFRTNENDTLSVKKTITDECMNSQSLSFLVGYFYFTGFLEIYKEISDDVPLKILVGLDADVDTQNFIYEYSVMNPVNNKPVKEKIKLRYFEALKNIFSKIDDFDTSEMQKAFELFIRKLDNGTLEVRKTREPNHAKMYIFKMFMPSGNPEGRVLLGSSNLSYEGLKKRNEVNVFLKESNDYMDAAAIFSRLWEDSIELVSKRNKDEFIKEVLEKTWLKAEVTPYLLYIRVLYEYFEKSYSINIKTPSELTGKQGRDFFDVKYQLDAIREGVQKIKLHSGVIIADVVGLGKSIIASCIAKNIDEPVVVVSPPHLKTQWEEYASVFRLDAKIITEGDLEKTVKDYKSFKELIVIVDEAHRYRNEDTERYSFLHKLCAGRKVILLSATPFNNNPGDVFSMVKLFEIPANSTIQTVENLGNQMRYLLSEYRKLKKKQRENSKSVKEIKSEMDKIAGEIRVLLEPITIRRTRLDLLHSNDYLADLKSQGIEFSSLNPPEEQYYELGDLTQLYIETLNKITLNDNGGFTGARYMPLVYLKDKAVKKYLEIFDTTNFTPQKNMGALSKQLLVRRFESSMHSFKKTLSKMLDSMKQTYEWYQKGSLVPIFKKGQIPNFDDVETLAEQLQNDDVSVDDVLDVVTEQYSDKVDKGLVFVKKDELITDFEKDLKHDIELFELLKAKWEKQIDDPKLNGIISKIEKSLQAEPDRKIIIFSEFSDTADYLFNKMFGISKFIKPFKYTSGEANKKNRETIRANFDAGIEKENQVNEYNVLIATDAISEGYSLHRAGTIYNYDIPYNPTRVIQRIGRINRMNKKVFEKLNIFNFFPSPTGEAMSHTKEISTFKMALFHALFGSDTQVLTPDEPLKGYLDDQFNKANNEEESWYTEYRNELNDIKTQEPLLYRLAIGLPMRCRVGRKITDSIKPYLRDDGELQSFNSGVLVFAKRGDANKFAFACGNSARVMNPEDTFPLFKCGKYEDKNKLSEEFYRNYKNALEAKDRNQKVLEFSKNENSAYETLNGFKINVATKVEEKEKIDDIINVLKMGVLPEYIIKEISALTANNLQELFSILPEHYINMFIDKNINLENMPRLVVLSEEFA